MTVQTYQILDAPNGDVINRILVDSEAAEEMLNADPGQGLWRLEIIELPPPPPLTIADVNNEVVRRLIVLTEARDEKHLDYIQMRDMQEALTLQQIPLDGETLTAEQAARVVELGEMRDKITQVRDAGNVLSATEPIPADYKDDNHWPDFTHAEETEGEVTNAGN